MTARSIQRQRYGAKRPTSDDLRPLKVLIRVDVAWREGKIESHQNQEKVNARPHGIISTGREPWGEDECKSQARYAISYILGGLMVLQKA